MFIMNCQDRVLCSNLNELVKKMVLAFCEVNVKFNNRLDVYGSIHIRADDLDIASMLLNEHCLRDQAVAGNNSIHSSNDHGDPMHRQNIQSTQITDQNFTKVIPNQTPAPNLGSVNLPSSAPMMQHRPLPHNMPPQQNMFASPVFFDVCGNSNMSPMPPNDPFRMMGFLPTPVTMATDNRVTQSQEIVHPPTVIDTIPDNLQQIVHEEGTPDDANHEMSATESALPPPQAEGHELVNPDLHQWQQSESTNSNAPSVLTNTGALDADDSDSNHDTSSSSQGGGVTYRCRICRQTFSDMKVYTHHVGLCKYKCGKCNRTFSMKHHLDSHTADEHGVCHSNNNKTSSKCRYQCNMCDQNFKTRAALNSHMTFRHRH